MTPNSIILPKNIKDIKYTKGNLVVNHFHYILIFVDHYKKAKLPTIPKRIPTHISLTTYTDTLHNLNYNQSYTIHLMYHLTSKPRN